LILGYSFMPEGVCDMPVKNSDRIVWYRSPVDRDVLAALNQRSDWKGLLQTLGHLGLLVLTGAGFWIASEKLSLAIALMILFLHGTIFAFLLNGFHELCHRSVFKTRALNVVFLYIFSFLGWYNPILFWASHQEHHKFTLHPPDDLEVVLPVKLALAHFLKSALVSPWEFYVRLRDLVRFSLGRLQGDWENYLFPPTAVEQRQRLFNWARIELAGQILIVAGSLALGLWQIPVLITLAPFYGGWLLFLCNNTQHIGLQDNVPDYRLCVRTIYLNPVVEFLYWHMNFHTEHHMYAAVPCYNLAKLHEQIKGDLPHCPAGLYETWKGIIAILREQETNPTYQFIPDLPTPGLPVS
jgi:fatty acid desaturase